MKKYFLIQALILMGPFNAALRAMDNEQKSQKPFYLCKQMLTIDPNAPAADYKALAQRLHDAKLSTCECATYLAQEKRQKALIALKKEEFLSEKGMKRINKFQDEIKKVNEPLNKLVVTISEYLPDDVKDNIKKEIIDHFSPKFSSIKFKKKSDKLYNYHPTGAAISCYLPTEFRYLKKLSDHVQIKHSSLNIGLDISHSSCARKFTYLHEEHHLKDRHPVVFGILEKTLIKESAMSYNELDKLSNLHNKFSRALETEADLIPTACGSCIDSHSAVERFDALPKDDLKHHGTHPSILTRYKRAQRIYNLKLAEKELVQKEEPQLL